MKRFLISIVILLSIASCRNTPQGKSAGVPVRVVDENMLFQYGDLDFLDSIRRQKAEIKWLDKGGLYDTMFSRYSPETDTMQSEVIRIDTFTARGSSWISVLMATRPLEWTCHPCGPLMEIYSFDLSGVGKAKYSKREVIAHYGTFGNAADDTIVKIGVDRSAYLFKPDFVMGGLYTSELYLYEIGKDIPTHCIWDTHLASADNTLMYPHSSRAYYYETKLRLIESESAYRRLIVNKKGTNLVGDKIINIDSTFTYAYRNGKYEIRETKVNEKNTGSK